MKIRFDDRLALDDLYKFIGFVYLLSLVAKKQIISVVKLGFLGLHRCVRIPASFVLRMYCARIVLYKRDLCYRCPAKNWFLNTFFAKARQKNAMGLFKCLRRKRKKSRLEREARLKRKFL